MSILFSLNGGDRLIADIPGGTVVRHDKLICGFGGNPLTLASDSYYAVEITARATQPVSCGVFLNPMGG